MKPPFLTRGALEKELSLKADALVRLVHYILHPYSVALFVSTGEKGEFSLASVYVRDPGTKKGVEEITLSHSFLGRTASEIGEIWIRELSPRAGGWLSLKGDETRLESIRLIPFQLSEEADLLLVVDFDKRPESDPIDAIEPLLRLFVESASSQTLQTRASHGFSALPMPIFLRRIMAPFIDISLKFIPIKSMGLSLWGPPTSGGEILEAICERDRGVPTGQGNYFMLGPLRCRWSTGSPRKNLLSREKTDRGTSYFPIVIGGEVLGSISLVTAGQHRIDGACGSLVTILAWSIEKELKLVAELLVEGKRGCKSISNPYLAVIRLLDEWSNASRYHEYLSLGLLSFALDGIDRSLEAENRSRNLDEKLCAEIENAMRKGDILIRCNNGEMALIFPRTSPEGAGNALRRFENLLRGKILRLNGSSVRVLSADCQVLCYPSDLTTEEVVLEKCGQVFIPSLQFLRKTEDVDARRADAYSV